jgi:cyclic pyranopterin phosphate synthase
MPKEIFGRDYRFLQREEILSYEEIARLAGAFARRGVRKIRITGGEPLVRSNLPDLVRMLSAVPGLRDLALTTNGILLPEQAAALHAAGLRRVTVSLDTLDDEVFRRMNDVGVSVARVLAGIDAALSSGLSPVKVNAVVKRGVNDHTVEGLAARFRGTGVIVRFIEYMDVGTSNGWRLDDVVPAREILERIHARWPLERVDPVCRGEVARRWRYRDGKGEIGLIASVSRPFCGDCTRARLSPEGVLYTCLFASSGEDLRAPLRGGATDEDLDAAVATVWRRRDDHYSEIRSSRTTFRSKIEMSYIGG